MKNITVIGAGTMGNGIAHTFAQNDFNVNLVDISEEALDDKTRVAEERIQTQRDIAAMNNLSRRQ